jgi:hypothetical protein
MENSPSDPSPFDLLQAIRARSPTCRDKNCFWSVGTMGVHSRAARRSGKLGRLSSLVLLSVGARGMVVFY